MSLQLDPLYRQQANLIAAVVANLLRQGRGTTVAQEYCSAIDAARFLGIPERTLEKYRAPDAGGPRFFKVGRSIRYKLSDLDAWMENHEGGTK